MARKTYSNEFRESAVKMVTEQKRTLAEAARNLGVQQGTLRYWIQSHRERSGTADAAEEKALRKRNRELEAENQKLRLEREILKKAAAFFAKEQRP
jgi:transposase